MHRAHSIGRRSRRRVTAGAVAALVALSVAAPVGGAAARAPADAATESRIFFSGCAGEQVGRECRDAAGERMRTELMSILPDGSGATRLTENDLFEHQPVWSPNAATIAYSVAREPWECDFSGGARLRLMRSDGSNDRALRGTRREDFECDYATDWSADGARILFERVCGLCRNVLSIRRDGTGLRALTHLGDETDVAYFNARWARGGRKVVVLLRKYREHPGPYVMDADGSGRERLRLGLRPYALDVSPGGGKLALAARPEDGPVSGVYVAGVDGDHVRLVAGGFNGVRFPRWSPDGHRLAFYGYTEGEGYDDGSYYVVNRDGTGLTELDGEDMDAISYRELGPPFWSPDGSRLAFTAEDPSGCVCAQAVAVADADGSGVEVLTPYLRDLIVWGWEAVPAE